MGYPVAHSRSPTIHRLFAAQTGEAIRYELLEVAPNDLETAIRQFQATGGKGLNITVPHKEAVVRLVDHLSDRAQLAGAANTLSFEAGQVLGDNTDGIGLIKDLTSNLHIPIEDARILILGAGGATRGIVGPLLDMRPAELWIANRTLDKAEALLERFGHLGNLAVCGFDAVPAAEKFDLLVNATSASLSGELPPYPETAIGSETICYDLAYALQSTPFCAWSRACGAAKAIMGWGMLVEQAAESFHIWRGIRPDTGPVLKQLAVSA